MSVYVKLEDVLAILEVRAEKNTKLISQYEKQIGYLDADDRPTIEHFDLMKRNEAMRRGAVRLAARDIRKLDTKTPK